MDRIGCGAPTSNSLTSSSLQCGRTAWVLQGCCHCVRSGRKDLDGNIARISTAVDEAGGQGVKLAVLPEQATIGYIFDSFSMVRPYLDTVPGKTTAALAKITARRHMYVAVGIAEIDPITGLGYNTAALVGPNG